MEPVLIASYQQLLKTHAHDCSVDRILEDPELRREFLVLVRTGAVDRRGYEIRHGPNNLRNKNKRPRREDASAEPNL